MSKLWKKLQKCEKWKNINIKKQQCRKCHGPQTNVKHIKNVKNTYTYIDTYVEKFRKCLEYQKNIEIVENSENI